MFRDPKTTLVGLGGAAAILIGLAIAGRALWVWDGKSETFPKDIILLGVALTGGGVISSGAGFVLASDSKK